MLTKFKIYLIALITCFILISCESENDSGFSIKFSDGTIISEKDIAFYDSSTCFLFLNKELDLVVGTGEPPSTCTEFIVFVNNDIIYQGVIYPDFHYNAVPPRSIYISSKTYPTFKSNILTIKGFRDIINDHRIIMILEESNLLHHGITCTIDSVSVSSDNDTTVLCTITYKNYDQVNYYIPDPFKMAIPVFNSITQITLVNTETKEDIYVTSNFWITSDWNWKMSDLSILESNSKVTYTFKSPCSATIGKGLYDCYLWLDNNKHFLPFPIPLDQEGGRVWVGQIYSSVKNIMIE